jgi:hypothetical protein
MHLSRSSTAPHSSLSEPSTFEQGNQGREDLIGAQIIPACMSHEGDLPVYPSPNLRFFRLRNWARIKTRSNSPLLLTLPCSTASKSFNFPGALLHALLIASQKEPKVSASLPVSHSAPFPVPPQGPPLSPPAASPALPPAPVRFFPPLVCAPALPLLPARLLLLPSVSAPPQLVGPPLAPTRSQRHQSTV